MITTHPAVDNPFLPLHLTSLMDVMPPPSQLFFVYGTLKQGHGNNYLLRDSKLIGSAVSKENYLLYNLGFPGAVREEEGAPVLGELYEVNDEQVVASMDFLESNGNFYTRYLRPFTLASTKEEVTAWIYELPKRLGSDLCPLNEQGVYYWDDSVRNQRKRYN